MQSHVLIVLPKNLNSREQHLKPREEDIHPKAQITAGFLCQFCCSFPSMKNHYEKIRHFVTLGRGRHFILNSRCSAGPLAIVRSLAVALLSICGGGAMVNVHHLKSRGRWFDSGGGLFFQKFNSRGLRGPRILHACLRSDPRPILSFAESSGDLNVGIALNSRSLRTPGANRLALPKIRGSIRRSNSFYPHSWVPPGK